MNEYKAALRNYAVFSGRASRRDYWMAVLINTAILIALFCLAFGGTKTGGLLPYAAYALATFLPMLALGVRRLHDTNRSGWWLLIGVVPIAGAILLLVWLCADTKTGPNKYAARTAGAFV